MGRGDKRSKKGKIWRGTYGKSRPRPSEDAYIETEPKEKKEEKPKKKPTPKKKK